MFSTTELDLKILILEVLLEDIFNQKMHRYEVKAQMNLEQDAHRLYRCEIQPQKPSQN